MLSADSAQIQSFLVYYTFSPLCPTFLEQFSLCGFFFFPSPVCLELGGGFTKCYTAENKECCGSYFLNNMYYCIAVP